MPITQIWRMGMTTWGGENKGKNKGERETGRKWEKMGETGKKGVRKQGWENRGEKKESQRKKGEKKGRKEGNKRKKSRIFQKIPLWHHLFSFEQRWRDPTGAVWFARPISHERIIPRRPAFAKTYLVFLLGRKRKFSEFFRSFSVIHLPICVIPKKFLRDFSPPEPRPPKT